MPENNRWTSSEAERLVVWTNKHEFMKLDIGALDKLNVKSLKRGESASPWDSGMRKEL